MIVIATLSYQLLMLSSYYEQKRRPQHNHAVSRQHNHDVSSTSRVIFFVHVGDKQLSPIYCCAVLSASRHNPDAVIIVYMENKTASWPHHRRCYGGQHNVKTFEYSLRRLFSGTLLSGWYKKILTGGFGPGNTMQNIANAARLALIYKKGGMYLDMDIITLASYAGMPVNIVGAQGWGYKYTQKAGGGLSVLETILGIRCWHDVDNTCCLNNAAMSFEPQHPFLHAYIREFVANFRNNKWGWNGPDRISDTCRKYKCDMTSTFWGEKMSDVCAGVQAVHDETFTPIHYSKAKAELGKNVTSDEWKDTMAQWNTVPRGHSPRTVYAVHIFNTARHMMEQQSTHPQSTDTHKMRLDHLLTQECGAQWREL
jgi:hypothetical protein